MIKQHSLYRNKHNVLPYKHEDKETTKTLMKHRKEPSTTSQQKQEASQRGSKLKINVQADLKKHSGNSFFGQEKSRKKKFRS